MKLSQYFTVEELTASDFADRYGIDNTPNAQQMAALAFTCELMDDIRAFLGVPVLVSSGFRCPAVNCLAGGAMTKTSLQELADHFNDPRVVAFARSRLAHADFTDTDSQHMLGEGVDWRSPAYGPPLKCATDVARSPLPYDQLIYEITWVHTSSTIRHPPRREVLTIQPGKRFAGLPRN